MFSLCVLVLTLLVSSSSGGPGNYNSILSKKELTKLYNSKVHKAELMYRPSSSCSGSRTGVRVTLEDGSQWLIHKSQNSNGDSKIVVVSAVHMSSRWKTLITKDFEGSRTVADFVRTGGSTYSVLANCLIDAIRSILEKYLLRGIFPFWYYFCK